MPNPRKPRENCLACNKELKERNRKYCDHKCANEGLYRDYIAKWQAGLVDGGNGRYGEVSNHVRRYLVEKYGNQCAECGWSRRHPLTGNVPINVEHIDGDSGNNREENLVLLCPNCHSLTTTFGALNKGRGPKSRMRE